MKITISPLQSKHCAQIAKLHMEYLRTPLKGWSGEKLLSLYYKTFVNCEGLVGYVAENSDGNMEGYVCGIWIPGVVKIKYISNNWPLLVLLFLVQLITNPCLVVSLFNWRSIGENRSGIGQQDYELRPIVVNKSARRKGVGRSLVKALAKDARERGFKSIYLLTQGDNKIAQDVYEKLGFQLMNKYGSDFYYELDLL